MTYTTHHYNHIGHYACTKCGYKRQNTQYTITSVDLEKGEMTIDGKHTITLALKSLYNIYNILSAYTVASIVGVDGAKIAADMNNYVLKNGRVITFELGGRQGTLLTSKHENSISYDQSIRVASACKDGCDVMFIVDAVSRKYFTSDVSWLYDIDFEMLDNGNIHQIVLAGKYVNDLAVRFSYTDIPDSKIKRFEDIGEAVDFLNSDRREYIYVITCFSDKGKFLAKVKGE
jgi:UDP-N-acetylmuramyl tripeptide synthase